MKDVTDFTAVRSEHHILCFNLPLTAHSNVLNTQPKHPAEHGAFL